MVLALPPGAVVDVDVVAHGSWLEAVELPGLGAELLEGTATAGRRRVRVVAALGAAAGAAASEAILHEAASARCPAATWTTRSATPYARSAMTPLDENHQALLIRLYRLAGDDAAAGRQFAACTEMLERELGVAPGSAVGRAAGATGRDPAGPPTGHRRGAARSRVAAVSAGAVETGRDSLRTAVRLADDGRLATLRVRSPAGPGRGADPCARRARRGGPGGAARGRPIALADGDRASVAQARAELGYVDFLRARYDRAELWLTDALRARRRLPLP